MYKITENVEPEIVHNVGVLDGLCSNSKVSDKVTQSLLHTDLLYYLPLTLQPYLSSLLDAVLSPQTEH